MLSLSAQKESVIEAILRSGSRFSALNGLSLSLLSMLERAICPPVKKIIINNRLMMMMLRAFYSLSLSEERIESDPSSFSSSSNTSFGILDGSLLGRMIFGTLWSGTDSLRSLSFNEYVGI